MADYMFNVATKIFVDGYDTEIVQRNRAKFIGATVVDNPITKTTEVTFTSLVTSATLNQVLTNGNNAGGLILSNIGSPSASYDAANKYYVDTSLGNHGLFETLNVSNESNGLNILLTGGSHIQDLAWQNDADAKGNKIINLSDAYLDSDAATLSQTKRPLSQVLSYGNQTGGYNIDMVGQRILQVGTPTLSTDAATKGYVDNHDPDGYDLAFIYGAQKDPTGFEDRTTTIISVNSASRTFAIAPVSGSFYYLYRGNKVIKSTTQSVVFPDSEGTHYFYFDGNGVLQTYYGNGEGVYDIILNNVITAMVYWDADNNQAIIIGDERHGLMDVRTHIHLHNSIGAQWYSGGALGNFVIGAGTLATHAQFDCSTVTYADEDIKYIVSDGSPQDLTPVLLAPIYYRSGATGNWRKKTADSFPIIYSGTAGYTGANGRLPYNTFNGVNWVLTECTNGNFVLCHYFGTNDINTPIIGIHGQAEYNTLAAAQAGAETEMNTLSGTSSLLGPEFIRLGTVIFQTATSYSNTPKAKIVQTAEGANYVDFRGNAYRGSNVAVSDHGNLTGLLDDDHTQYLLINGTRAMTSTLNMGTYGITNAASITASTGTLDLISTGSQVVISPYNTNKILFDTGYLTKKEQTSTISNYNQVPSLGTMEQIKTSRNVIYSQFNGSDSVLVATQINYV